MRDVFECALEWISGHIGYGATIHICATVVYFLAGWLGYQFVAWEWQTWPLETQESRFWLVLSFLIAALSVKK